MTPESYAYIFLISWIVFILTHGIMKLKIQEIENTMITEIVTMPSCVNEIELVKMEKINQEKLFYLREHKDLLIERTKRSLTDSICHDIKSFIKFEVEQDKIYPELNIIARLKIFQPRK